MRLLHFYELQLYNSIAMTALRVHYVKQRQVMRKINQEQGRKSWPLEFR
jgi:hypothetical protein